MYRFGLWFVCLLWIQNVGFSSEDRDYREEVLPTCYWVRDFDENGKHTHPTLQKKVFEDRIYLEGLQRMKKDSLPLIRAGHGNFASVALQIDDAIIAVENTFPKSLISSLQCIKTFTTLRTIKNESLTNDRSLKETRRILMKEE